MWNLLDKNKADNIQFKSWDCTFAWSINTERWCPTSWRNVNWVSAATVLEDPFLALSRNDIVALTCILKTTRHILQKKEGEGWGRKLFLKSQDLIQLSILCKSFSSVLELFKQISQNDLDNKRLCLERFKDQSSASCFLIVFTIKTTYCQDRQRIRF